MANQPRGKVEINQEECKGCGVCVEACPPKGLQLSTELNHYGVHPAQVNGEVCSGCGICYFVCPEPGAITVYKLEIPKIEVPHAATV
ncbi:MAG TPA: ferredoxin family protein [Candidatus Saccharimonadales bacterium]|nr:ferredoxin family protein [Candidatus Saccharimonadales bacterium]